MSQVSTLFTLLKTDLLAQILVVLGVVIVIYGIVILFDIARMNLEIKELYK